MKLIWKAPNKSFSIDKGELELWQVLHRKQEEILLKIERNLSSHLSAEGLVDGQRPEKDLLFYHILNHKNDG